jgi:hypothetical protein
MGDRWERTRNHLVAAWEWSMGWDFALWARGGWWRPLAIMLAPAQLATYVVGHGLALFGIAVWTAGAFAVSLWPLAAVVLIIVALVTVTDTGGQDGAAPSGGAKCEPSYPDDCLSPDAVDYDCAGGEGDGPRYVEGPVTVTGSDPFGLDNDGDGTGCEY